MSKTGLTSYGSNGYFDSQSRKGNAYSHVRAEDDDRETAPEGHMFSLMPIGIALSFTAALIYAILVIQHLRTSAGAPNHPDVKPWEIQKFRSFYWGLHPPRPQSSELLRITKSYYSHGGDHPAILRNILRTSSHEVYLKLLFFFPSLSSFFPFSRGALAWLEQYRALHLGSGSDLSKGIL